MKKVCLNCGVTFYTDKKEKKFCSNKCYHDHLEKYGTSVLNPKKDVSCNENYVQVQCCICGKIEYVTKARAKKYKTCSKECVAKYLQQRNSRKLKLTCPICGREYEAKASAISHHKTCGDKECRSKWLSLNRSGSNNPNYLKVQDSVKKKGLHNNKENNYKASCLYKHVVKECLGLNSINDIPKGYVIHHKDCNHYNNDEHNLIVLPKTAHLLVHKWFGNILLSALHTNKISRELFLSLCDNEQKEFYLNIIDLDVTNQAVVKQGELLENPEVGNQQPSVYRNIYEGSTTNGRVLTDDAEDSNSDTSALPNVENIGDEIV